MQSLSSGRPLFISLEGGDGVGKSTQQRMLAQWFERRGREAVTTLEPGGTELGRTLRREVLHGADVSPRVEALLYATDRAHHVAEVVRPALARDAVVITDRYLDSSVAYQGAARSLGTDEVRKLSLWATGGLLPDLTVLLDLDPAVGLTRLTGEPDRLESAGLEFHRAVRAQYLEMAAAEPERWLVVDASQGPEDVHAAIVAAVEARGLA